MGNGTNLGSLNSFIVHTSVSGGCDFSGDQPNSLTQNVFAVLGSVRGDTGGNM